MAALRIFLYYCRIAIHIAVALFKVALCLRFWTAETRRREIRSWSTNALDLFGISVEVIGVPSHPRPPHLFVANHTSWLDILVIQTQFDVVFVAKQDVHKWPAFGWIAERLGTVFVSRRQSQEISSHVAKLAEKLASGVSVCAFPEGTTSDGTAVLPFKTAMLQPAIDIGAPVQPLAIRYVHANGSRATEAAFIGDMSLVQSFNLLAGGRSIRACLHILPVIAATSATRRSLAEQSETAIRDALMSNDNGPVEAPSD